MESESYDKASTKEKNIFGEVFQILLERLKSELFLDNKHVSPKPFVIKPMKNYGTGWCTSYMLRPMANRQ